MKRRKPTGGQAPPEPFHNPFGVLKERFEQLPSAARPPTTSRGAASGPRRAVIRLERKGRNGKEVTLVEQLGLREEEMVSWLGELKQSLGCGGTVEGAALLFQGDQRERLERALRARGVERISVG